MWSAALVLMVVWLAALLAGHRRVAFLCALLVPALLFVETEWLWSPVSGLWSVSQRNIVGTFPGQAGGPTLVLAAHYDTATHFGVTPHGRGGASRFCPP
jgi:acetylornithine deacetylase/succinyl-diaminopimelate desuccinylase-like protein